MIDDEESLKTNQGKSVSAAPTSNPQRYQPERTRTDNMQIHLSLLSPTPVNTSPMISPPHSPSELYETDDLMDVDVDNSLEKKPIATCFVGHCWHVRVL